ncbi:MAG: FAD:protein FMN transferase [Thermodesulfobacteriota bacterium]
MNAKEFSPLKHFKGYMYILFFFLIVFPYSSFSEELFKFQQVLMGTVVEIALIGKDQRKAKKDAVQAFQEIRRIEQLMSLWIERGDVFRINQYAGRQWVKVSPETLYLIKKSIEISERSEGGFDITIAPLVELWRRAWAKGYPPSEEELKESLNLVGFRNIMIRPDCKILLKKEGMSIDLGGIAKGYAVDRAFELLRRLGYRNLIVNAGGDLRVGGAKFGQPWSIGIQDPRNSEKLIGKISLNDAAIATSGDYEKYFIYQEKRYHHILNPKNGMPAEGCRSVSVISKEAIFADAMATAIFVLGPEKGLRLCQDTKGLECVIIDNDGTINITSGLNEIFYLNL